jgi:dynein heavy chain
VFPLITYDPLDVAGDSFARDAAKFRKVVRDLEQRIGCVIRVDLIARERTNECVMCRAILVQGFDDCASVQSVFKLLDIFDVLIYRDGIRSAIEKKYPELFRMFGEDVERVHKIFAGRREAPPVFSNLPPVAGALSWCRGLLDRIGEPMKRIMTLVSGQAESDEARELSARHAHVTKELLDYEAARHQEWVASIDSQSDVKLNQFVLSRDGETGLLRVNFDPVLVRLLREAKYLEVRPTITITITVWCSI